MTTTASTAGTLGTQREGYPAGGVRFDLAMMVVSAWLIGGLFVDGWAHFHGMVDDSFFTPWHAVFYSGFTAVAIFLGINQWRNVSKGYPFGRALPEGYVLSLVGAGIFAVGGVGDLIWHTLFGIEVDTEALLSPTHLLLGTGMVLIVSGPLRAAWRRIPSGHAGGWRVFLPMLLSVTLLLAVLSFFTSYAHPFIDTHAARLRGGSTGSVVPVSELYRMNADGTGQTRLTMTLGSYGWAGAWSPGGSRIAFSTGSVGEAVNGQSDIYLMNPGGDDLTQLTSMEGEEYNPFWSPDGERIVFAHRTQERSDIYVIGAEGGEPAPLTDTLEHEFVPVWSPDGSQIIFTVSLENSTQLYTMQADGSNPVPLTSEGNNWGGSFSPDGSRLAFTSTRSNSADIYVMNADGRDQTPIIVNTEFDSSAAWSPDGSRIIFMSWRSHNAELYAVNADCIGSLEGCDATAINLTNNEALESDNPAWSPDGNQLVYTAVGHSESVGGSDPGVSLGIASALIQSALMMGLVLLVARQWVLPFGALALVFTLTTGLISVLADQYALVPVALIGGLVGDGPVRWLKPSSASPERYYLFGFLVPVVFYALYFGALQLTVGIGWTIHVWTGAIFLAGVVGLLLSALIIWVQESRTIVDSPRAA